MAGILPIVAVICGWLTIRNEYKSLVRDLEAIGGIIQAPEGTHDDPSAAMKAIREPSFN
ncbi:hypothetical protein ACFWWM_24570 [Streptomyces sp. NPDC058682]|uniref:hypothetical protein n=1 Tax=Streptomyces sp. NPDC058682 TaxID=3346596 RepID=UPI003649BB2B